MPEKILTNEQLIGERARLRRESRKLVFTNGVFDLYTSATCGICGRHAN